MSDQTVVTAATRIAEHAAAHRLARVHVVLHGGEPLLMGLAALRTTIRTLRATIEPIADLDLRLQSNGVRLTPALCDLFAANAVAVGISLDGDEKANDRHRRFADGSGSYAQVLRGLALLRRPQYRPIYAGLLCTIDIENDPTRVYRALMAQEPPRLDFLLPHATWDRPPRRPPDDPTPYATWLMRLYQRWVSDGRPVPIRLFDSLLSMGVGGPSGTEAVGLDPADLAVIETDGTWEQADSLKTAFDGAAATGLTIFDHSVDDVAAHPGIARRQRGLADLCHTCRACPVVRQCGGGLFAHRYRTGHGFDNPSAYCVDLKELILSINRPSSPLAPTAAVHAPHPASDRGGALPAGLLDAIGSGGADADMIDYLVRTQMSITRALVTAVAKEAARSAVVADGWALLAHLDQVTPEAVRTVLRHPYIRMWATTCLRRNQTSGPPLESYLACVAAAAAIHAGLAAELVVPVSEERIHLPTLGTLMVGSAAAGAAVMTTTRDGCTVRLGDEIERVVLGSVPASSHGWRPARRIATDDGLALLVEDADPYRDCHRWPPETRLPASAALAWERSIDRAWRGVQADAPDQVDGMRLALYALVPLKADRSGSLRSSTTRHAFGGVGIAHTEEHDAIAVMLVHEFQHSKLGAVLDICDLVDPTNRARIRVGWREALRPIEAALQGTYAHLAVAQVWRSRADRPGPHRSVATQRFQMYRQWVEQAQQALLATGGLTAVGERFTQRMLEVVQSWRH